jgi:hypothetical protein
MATPEKKVVADLGSEELKQVRLQLNHVIDVLDAIFVQVAGNVDYAAFQTDAALIDVSALRKIVSTLELPEAPTAPLTPVP